MGGDIYYKNPLRSSQLTCGRVYFQITSAFESWKSHGTAITMSPSRIHVRFFIEPGIRPIRKIPSIHRNRTRFAPSMFSTVASTSRFSLRGVRTRVICGSACVSTLLFFLYRLIPHSFVWFYLKYVCLICVIRC